MNELTWTECVLIGATAGVDPTVVRRMARGANVRRSSRVVVMDAASKLGLSRKLASAVSEGLPPVENAAA